MSEGGRGRLASTSIVAIAAGLMGIGAVITFSVSVSAGQPVVPVAQWGSASIRQFVLVVAGLAAMLMMTRIPYHVWFAWRGWFALVPLALAAVMLALVFVPGVGVEVNGARRWVQLPGSSLRFQPSELLKAALPIFLAGWMAYRVNIGAFWRGLMPAVGVIGVCVAVVGIEDFGTAALLAAVAGGMLLMGGAKWRHLFLLVLPAVAAFGYLLRSRPHRIERLVTFIDPWKDPEGKGYQVIQSLCTIASGGWWGRGLGGGFGKGYLPQAHNDFVFAVICEELGMIGAVTVIALLVALMWHGRGVIRRCVDPAGRLLALGITLVIGFQAAMNIAVVTSAAPTKGISLPLVSAGGSGTIVLGALVGVLASIARCSRGKPELGAKQPLRS